ncbi:MAG: hypothetical protein AABN33_19900 [Acidobacteriota bacterium]
MSQKGLKPVVALVVPVIALMLSVIVVSWLLETQDLSPAVRLGLALVPVILWIFSLAGYRRLIQEADELVRRIHLEALAFAFSGLAVAIMACEYLRKAGFISLLKPDYVLMMMIAFLLIGFVIARRRYL